MTDQEILDHAHRAYTELGVKPTFGEWYNIDPSCACLLSAACYSISEGQEVVRSAVRAQSLLHRTLAWIKGTTNGWDGIASACAANEYYQAGYAFGEAARVAYAHTIPEDER